MSSRTASEPHDEHHLRAAGPEASVLVTGAAEEVDGAGREDDGAADDATQILPRAADDATQTVPSAADDATQILPGARGGGPVFVDTTGRRRGLIRLACYAVLAVVAGYGALIATSLLGGPVSPGSLVPFPDVLGGQEADKQPEAERSQPGADRPASPTNSVPAPSSGRAHAATPSATSVVVAPATTPTRTIPTTPNPPAGTTAPPPTTQPTGPGTDPTPPDADPTTATPTPTETPPATGLPDVPPGEAEPLAGAAG